MQTHGPERVSNKKSQSQTRKGSQVSSRIREAFTSAKGKTKGGAKDWGRGKNGGSAPKNKGVRRRAVRHSETIKKKKSSRGEDGSGKVAPRSHQSKHVRLRKLEP